MKRISVYLVAIEFAVSVLVFTASAEAATPVDPAATPALCQPATWSEYHHAVKRYWKYGQHNYGHYYAAPKPSNERQLRLGEMRNYCSNTIRKKKMFRYVTRRKQEWRFHRYIDNITGYGEWVIQPGIVMCESGGIYTKWNHGSNDPERASGAYQIQGPTWRRWGGQHFAKYAAYAPPWAQHIVARKIWRGQGRGAWAC